MAIFPFANGEQGAVQRTAIRTLKQRTHAGRIPANGFLSKRQLHFQTTDNAVHLPNSGRAAFLPKADIAAAENPSAAAMANPQKFVGSECGSDGDTPSIPRYAMRSASTPSIIARLTLGCLPWPLDDWHPSVPLVIEQTWNRGHDSVWVFECSRARLGAFMDV